MNNMLRQFSHELGWPGIGGVVLLLAGLVFLNAVLTPVEEQALRMREEAAEQDTRVSLGAEMQRQTSSRPTAMLQRFYDFFTTDLQITDYLARIYKLAQANGLELRKGDYKTVRNKGERLTQYQISLPLRGGYNQIRSFAAQVLDEIPVLSMDQISFERKQPGDPAVEAEIMFTLYVEYMEQQP